MERFEAAKNNKTRLGLYGSQIRNFGLKKQKHHKLHIIGVQMDALNGPCNSINRDK